MSLCTFVACILIAVIIPITFGGDGMLTNKIGIES